MRRCAPTSRASWRPGARARTRRASTSAAQEVQDSSKGCSSEDDPLPWKSSPIYTGLTASARALAQLRDAECKMQNVPTTNNDFSTEHTSIVPQEPTTQALCTLAAAALTSPNSTQSPPPLPPSGPPTMRRPSMSTSTAAATAAAPTAARLRSCTRRRQRRCSAPAPAQW